jgi:hypothetical protein
MPDTQQPAEPRYLFAVRPRCEECKSYRLLRYGKPREASGDDSEARYVRCGDCGAKFILVLE